jgi:hypothetical protein
MATQTEEQQAKEFLKRAEIRTMRKDLRALREVDALKERDKIAKIKTLEEQLAEKRKADLSAVPSKEKNIVEVLQRNEKQEKLAEKDLKNYANEDERQQIFLLESQRLDLEKQIDAIDKQKDPAVKLEKNNLLLQKRDTQTRLDSVLAEEKKLEDEQKFITEKEQVSQIPSEKKSLEQSRWDLDKKIQDVERKRWEIEKQIGDIDSKIAQLDASLEQLVIEKNNLQDKVLGIEKSLREIYTVVIAREEDKRRGLAQEQIARKEAISKMQAEQNERVQREQWSPGFKRVTNISQTEQEERRKFLGDVEDWSGTKNETTDKSVLEVPVPPIPQRKK